MTISNAVEFVHVVEAALWDSFSPEEASDVHLHFINIVQESDLVQFIICCI